MKTKILFIAIILSSCNGFEFKQPKQHKYKYRIDYNEGRNGYCDFTDSVEIINGCVKYHDNYNSITRCGSYAITEL